MRACGLTWPRSVQMTHARQVPLARLTLSQVLVDHMDTKYTTCDAYCQTFNCVCIGAWDDAGDTCDQLNYHNCAHDFGSYTNDAICACNPQPDGVCPDGARPPKSILIIPPSLPTAPPVSLPLGGHPLLADVLRDM